MPTVPKEFRIRMQGPADLQIGKAGISEGIINQIIELLKKYRLIKIRVLRNAPNFESITTVAGETATATDSSLGLIRGKCFLLYKGNWRGRLQRSLASSLGRPH